MKVCSKTAPTKLLALLALALLVVGCADETQVESVIYDNSVRNVQRVFAIGNMGIANADDVKAFQTALSNSFKACNVDVAFVQVLTNSMGDVEEKDQERIKSQIRQYRPDSFLEINEVSHTVIMKTGAPMGPSKYRFVVKNSSGKRVWAAMVEPEGFLLTDEHLYGSLATEAVRRMRQDNVLGTCVGSADNEETKHD